MIIINIIDVVVVVVVVPTEAMFKLRIAPAEVSPQLPSLALRVGGGNAARRRSAIAAALPSMSHPTFTLKLCLHHFPLSQRQRRGCRDKTVEMQVILHQACVRGGQSSSAVQLSVISSLCQR